MGEKKYQVLFYGEILPGADIASVKKNLADIFNVDKNKIEGLFSGGKKVVKKDASRAVCEKTKEIFETAGAVVSVVPQPARPEPAAVPEELEPEREAEINEISASVDQYPSGKINKTALLLLTFSLGAFGTHKFYLARYVQGFLYMLFSWTLIPFIASLFDALVYVFTSEEKLNARYKTGSIPLMIIMAVCGPFLFIIAMVVMLAMAFPLLLVAGQGEEILLPILERMTRQSVISVQTGSTGTPPPPSAPRTKPLKRIPPAGGAPAAAPGGTCSGKIKGRNFSVDQAFIQGDVLHLGQGNDVVADQEVVVFLFLDDTRIADRRIHVSPDDRAFNNPHIHLKWKNGDNDQTQSSVAMNGYDLDLEFGPVNGGTVPGKIDLYIPGQPETRLTGTFTADIAGR